MTGPSNPTVPYPIFVCPMDGVVFDRRRDLWHGIPEEVAKLICPACGGVMEHPPQEAAPRIFYCYQCGTTYDRERRTWYGLAYYHPTPLS
jgi:hypothetical protein